MKKKELQKENLELVKGEPKKNQERRTKRRTKRKTKTQKRRKKTVKRKRRKRRSGYGSSLGMGPYPGALMMKTPYFEMMKKA